MECQVVGVRKRTKINIRMVMMLRVIKLQLSESVLNATKTFWGTLWNIPQIVTQGTNEESIYLLSPIPIDKVLPCESLTLLHFQVVHSWESSNSCRLPSWLPILCLQRSPGAESERCRGCNSGKGKACGRLHRINIV